MHQTVHRVFGHLFKFCRIACGTYAPSSGHSLCILKGISSLCGTEGYGPIGNMKENKSIRGTQSIWMGSSVESASRPLDRSLDTDVCIVGAGIAGLSTAYSLSCEGKSVVVLDDGSIGGGMTERTTAHLSNVIDDGYVTIERLHGKHGARTAADSHTAAIDRIETIVVTERFDCDFERVDGFLFPAPGHPPERLEEERLAALRAGLVGVERIERPAGPVLEAGGCLRFPRQAQFHPVKFVTGLAQAIERCGGRIFTDTHVSTVKGGQQARIETRQGHAIVAQSVVVATNTPINDMVVVHTKQAPYTTYVLGAGVPNDSVPVALYWDQADPYHYVRIQKDAAANGHDLLIVGGEDHKTGQANDGAQRYQRLERWARKRFPMMERIEYRWSGQVMEPTDGLALIGRNPDDTSNVYIATGDSGMGMTHGMIAGMLITDLIQERDNDWAALYDPSRKSLKSIGTFVQENLNVAAQYADWVSAGDIGSEDQIPKDSGAVLRSGVQKVAVYRDEEGTVHRRSAVCPHLKCIVAWDSIERTWNCPCHGSRFDAYGKVLNGPANSDLSPIET
jgi:glycine/D-amino acid oxidase-like deaminating enzyme/nitrite reductase/ring-hydroxylating ferredoxin subunit